MCVHYSMSTGEEDKESSQTRCMLRRKEQTWFESINHPVLFSLLWMEQCDPETFTCWPWKLDHLTKIWNGNHLVIKHQQDDSRDSSWCCHDAIGRYIHAHTHRALSEKWAPIKLIVKFVLLRSATKFHGNQRQLSDWMRRAVHEDQLILCLGFLFFFFFFSFFPFSCAFF